MATKDAMIMNHTNESHKKMKKKREKRKRKCTLLVLHINEFHQVWLIEELHEILQVIHTRRTAKAFNVVTMH
jgi:hypothetical protein